MEDRILGGLQHHHKMCCEKGDCCKRRACNLEMISLWGCNFWIGGLVYNIFAKTKKELEERIIYLLKIAEKYNIYFK